MGVIAPDHEISAFNGGVNLRDGPLMLGAADLVTAQNVVPIAGGSLQGRGGQTELFSTHIDSNPIRSLYRFQKQSGTRISVATSGTKVYTVSSGGATQIDSGYTTDKKFSIVTWSVKDKIYWINGVEVLKSYDGTTVATVGGSPPVGTQVELHDDRLWILQANLVYFSDLNADATWPGANALSLSDKYGGSGSFIKSFGRGLLVIGKDSGLYRFEGSPKLGGKLTRYSDVKAVAPWSAAIVSSQKDTPDSLLFLGADGVYATNGFDCTLISSKLDPLFAGFYRGAVGRYYPSKRQYFLSFSTTGAANDQLWTATYLNTPNGPAISWIPYTGFKAESFSVWDGIGDAGEMYYGRSDDGKIRRLDTGLQDVGSDYKCSFQTRWENFGSTTRAKQARWLYPVFEATHNVNYQVGYTFGRKIVSGPLDDRGQGGIVWGPGSVTWGPGTVTWVDGGPLENDVTSVLNFQWGRYLSFYFENTGDGSNFKFHNLGLQYKVKDAHLRQPFAIAS